MMISSSEHKGGHLLWLLYVQFRDIHPVHERRGAQEQVTMMEQLMCSLVDRLMHIEQG